MIAPEYFENGDAAIETVCHQVDKWPTPNAGQTLQLPFLGNVLQVSFIAIIVVSLCAESKSSYIANAIDSTDISHCIRIDRN